MPLHSVPMATATFLAKATAWAAGKLVALESEAFDALHSVDTSCPGGKQFAAVDPNITTSFEYLPTRPGTIRKLLHDLPIENLDRYTFVDVGSGKGRVLLLAAELPFLRVQGVELSPELHAQAVRNIRSARGLLRRTIILESRCQNAVDYRLPDTDLVLFLANPFAPLVMRTVLEQAIESRRRVPRDIVLVFYFCEYDPVGNLQADVRTLTTGRRHRICRIVS